jgi:hypothetical protein
MSDNGPLPADKPQGVLVSIRNLLARRPHLIPAMIAAAMLLAALGKWPYDYYTVMRWVVCAVAVFVAYQGWAFRKYWVSWAFGFTALLFNPLVPVHFRRETWQVFDSAAAAAFVVIAVALARPPRSAKSGEPGGSER